MRRCIGRMVVGVCAAVLVVSASGCSLMTPSLGDAETVTYAQTIDDSLLVQAGTLTVAVNTADAPQAMDQNGTVTGYNVDVARAIAERMGLELEVVASASPETALSEGLADLYIGADADDASDTVSVSGDCLQNATAVFGLSDAATTLTVATLSAATVGVQSSSASQETLDRTGISATQNTYDNVNGCFEALQAGEVDYVVCDATAGGYLARAYAGIEFLGTLSTSTSYGLAVSAQAGTLGTVIMDTFDELSSDGTLDAVHTVWYGHMPLDLSDSTVSGVTLTATSGDTDTDAATDTETSESDDTSSSTVDTMNTLG